MEKKNALNFLLYSYFGVTSDSDENELLRAAANRAYQDAASRVLSVCNKDEKEGLRNARPIWMAYAGITGFQIHKWYTEHRFCGKCGKKMKAKQTESAMQCLDCGRVVYPQICPSVIEIAV